ncbi:SDR family oxidoreductase [Nesterenkonia flava]|uniref:SDR family oxidoreductase n=1 Tax=Nesterenkonia flava TaxID=469799 RepID=A0ABU1FR17_9MICC|nr:SDR family oxidoreductase [Nesterenkonia flava]MDR5711089.1 SDR family oxidoreductase [Nesterenkonia flava]
MSIPTDKPTALVTGASRGIGRAIAEDLGRDHHIIVAGTSPERVEAAAQSLPSATPLVVDLRDIPAIPAALEQLQLQRLDVLVHNAGVAWLRPVADAQPNEWQEMFTVNLFAVAELTRLTLPLLREARGQVIAVNSGSGYVSRINSAMYSGTKFALRAFTDALREEERGQVRVTSIHPGRVDTDMQVQLQQQMGAETYDGSVYVSPESIARTVRLAVDMDPASTVEELSIRPVAQKR